MSDEEDLIPQPLDTEQTTVDAASRRTHTSAKRAQEREILESKKFWTDLLTTPVGRREMWRLLHFDAHAFNTDFAVGPNGTPDQYAAWYRRGEQDLGLRLYHRWMELAPEAIIAMHVENDPRFAKPKKRGS